MRLSRISTNYYFIIVAVAFVIYPLIVGTTVEEAGDTRDYLEAANIISNGYRQIIFRVPVYPLLLIVTGSLNHFSKSLFLLQYLFYFGSVMLLIAAMLRSGVQRIVLLIVTLLLVSPLLVQMTYLAMTEAISFALVNILFSAYLLLNGKYKYIIIGLVAALLTLTRPSFQLTALLVTAFLFITEKKKLQTMLFFLSFALPVFTFSFFNKQRFNFFGITPATGWHLTTKTALFVEEWPDKNMRPLMIRQRNINLVEKTSHTGSMFVWSLPRLLQDSLHSSYVEVSKYMMKNNMALIKSHPLDYLSAVGRSLVDYTFPNAISQKAGGITKTIYTLIQLVYVYLYLALTLMVLAFWWLFRGKMEKIYLNPFLLAAVIVYSNYFVSIAAEVGSSRHRAPTEGIILVGIVYALPLVAGCRKKVQTFYSVPAV